ncbi:MAG: hypothetical protein JO045_18360 [Mycobacterium sp.]|nr:hypothetical protein [Mycobacterium sp.]
MNTSKFFDLMKRASDRGAVEFAAATRLDELLLSSSSLPAVNYYHRHDESDLAEEPQQRHVEGESALPHQPDCEHEVEAE